MADVFLSYKREDRGRAREIAEGIETHGFSVFFDAEIDVGESFDERIEREIGEAKCVVVLWSAKSCGAKWVRREARFGSERDRLAPAIIGDCSIPLEFSDLQAANLQAWRGDPGAPEWRQFIGRITECVQKPAKDLKPQPWRRRWVRVLAGTLVGAGLAAGVAALVMLRPWESPAPVASSDPATQNAPADPTAASLASADLPGSVERVLQMSMAAGDCEGLAADMASFRATVPQIAQFERGYLSECRRRAPVQLALQSSSTSSSSSLTAASGAPAAPVEATRPPPANFIASLRAATTAPLSAADYAAVAAELGVEPAALEAAARVESGNTASFAESGRPLILFEPHLFSRRTDRRFDDSNPNVSYRNWDRTRYPRTQEGRWAQLEEAYALDPENALASTSWGRFQILGQNHSLMGLSAADFASKMARSERDQLEGFALFVRVNGVADALAAKDWAAFARRYNGSGQADRYSTLLREAYERIVAERG